MLCTTVPVVLFIFSRKVQIFTDHKPIVATIGKKITDVVSPRLVLKYNLKVFYLPENLCLWLTYCLELLNKEVM